MAKLEQQRSHTSCHFDQPRSVLPTEEREHSLDKEFSDGGDVPSCQRKIAVSGRLAFEKASAIEEKKKSFPDVIIKVACRRTLEKGERPKKSPKA